MGQQRLWRVLLATFIFLLAPWTAQAAIDPAKVQKLLARDGEAGDEFGWSVSMSADGNTALIGAVWDDDKGERSGSAYVFVRVADGSWTQQDKLIAADGTAEDRFGVSVSVSDDGSTALIGARGKNNFSGSAYVFVRDAVGSWTQQDKLIAADGAGGDLFGCSTSMSADGSTAIIGARGNDNKGVDSGSAYVFVRDAVGSWTQQDKLIAADGAEGDSFGVRASVSADGNTALIGAIYDDDKGRDSGSVYVFTRTGSVWIQKSKLTADDGTADGIFGDSVSVSADGEAALIGSPGSDNFSGSAYIFTRCSICGSWSQQGKFTVADGNWFGYTVSLSGNTALIAGYEYAYVFVRDAVGTWTQQAKLTAADGTPGDWFGDSVSMSDDGSTALIGAGYDDDKGTDSGSAYVFGSSSSAPPSGKSAMPWLNLLL